MRGGVLPAALLCAALGLALAFAPRRALLPALVTLCAAACAGVVMFQAASREAAFAGCWASVVVIALALHLPRGVPLWLALAMSICAGAFAGAVIGWEAQPVDLLRALPAALLCLPGRWIVRRGWPVALKVASSWLVAIALLSALLPTAATTPGYVPDHMQ